MDSVEELGPTKKQTCQGQSAVTLPVRPDSRAITKAKSKVRVVHDLAPEIITTDIANFRVVVQTLTGKQAMTGCGHGKTEEPEVPVPTVEKESSACGLSGGAVLAAGFEDMDAFVQSLVQYPHFPL